jgi:hypothetical protein
VKTLALILRCSLICFCEDPGLVPAMTDPVLTLTLILRWPLFDPVLILALILR